MAFYQIEPWGCEQEDFRAGRICELVHNVNAKRSQQRGWRYFIPEAKPGPARRQSAVEMQHRIRAALGKKRFKEG